MKDYVALLDDSDLKELCRIISPHSFRIYFKTNSNSFTQLKPGFRAETLSDEATIAVVCDNKERDFIRSFINKWIDSRLIEIEQYKSDLTLSGMDATEAEIEAYKNCLFSGNISLYFLLSGKTVGEDYLELLNYVLENGNLNKKVTDDAGAGEETQQIRIKQLEEELENARASLNQLTTKLASNHKESLTLEKKLNSYSSDAFANATESIYVTEGYDYSSLCIVPSYPSNGLIRLADVSGTELTKTFLISYPETDKLYQTGNAMPAGYVGIWDWRTSANKNGVGNDYIESVLKKYLAPIEMIVLKGKDSIQDIVENLKEGVQTEIRSTRLMISFFKNGLFNGVFLDEGKYDYKGGKLYLSASTVRLPVYQLETNEVLFFDEYNLCVLKHLRLGTPIVVSSVIDNMEIIKNLILSRVTWSAMSQNGITRATYKQIKSVLSDLQTNGLTEEVQNACECSPEEAEKLIEHFISHADSYISGDTLEDRIIAHVIQNDSHLYAACLHMVETDWMAQNDQKVKEAEGKLEEIRLEVQKEQKAIEDKKSELILIEGQIREAEKKYLAADTLASEVETKIEERITKARENAAAFIAENAFMNPGALHVEAKSENALSGKREDNFLYEDKPIDPNAENNTNWDDELKTIQIELQTAGVEDKYVNYLSGVLYSAFINRFALLLAGPYGKEIATALSYALFGRAPAVLRCGGAEVRSALQKCIDSDAEIIVIENMFSPGWYEDVLRLMEKKEKLYIAIHPFSEDLSIEPKGLLNYCLPIFTEQIIVNKPDEEFIGGIRAKEFQCFNNTEIERCYRKVCNKMVLNPSLSYKVSKMLSDVHLLLDERDYSQEILMLFLPIAVVLGRETSLLSFIEEDKDLVSNADQLHESINRMLGVADGT